MIERLSRYLKIPLEQHRHHRRPAERRADVQAERPEHRDGQRERGGAAPGDVRDDVLRRRGLRQRGRHVHPAARRAATGAATKATGQLHRLGQSLWLDNITRDLLTSGTLERYVSELSVTGLTSNPTIFEQAIKNSSAYDAAIRQKLGQGRSAEELFFELALEDLTRAADLFRPIHDRTNGVDGWVSLEVSPLLAYDTAGTLAAAKDLFARAGRPNLMIKIPGTREGLPAIEEAIFAGIPINVTLLFSREHYLAAAEAFLRGIERRIDAGLKPDVGSVASMFVSRWDAAVKDKVPDDAAQPARHRHVASAPTRRIDRCSVPRAGSASTTPAPGRSACCGRAPAPRIRRRPTCCTSRRWRPHSPSTRCPRPRSRRSQTTATSRHSCGRTEETAKRC